MLGVLLKRSNACVGIARGVTAGYGTLKATEDGWYNQYVAGTTAWMAAVHRNMPR
ncbi:hypothetical protein GCM10008094_10140 [Aidingimonas halophila]|nr:hypothetical protein GCM10008094_10140 [Aidingimonas halophila]